MRRFVSKLRFFTKRNIKTLFLYSVFFSNGKRTKIVLQVIGVLGIFVSVQMLVMLGK